LNSLTMASGLKRLNEDSTMLDEMSTLDIPRKNSKSRRSPNLRRHFSEGGINIDLSKLYLGGDPGHSPSSTPNDPTPTPNERSFDLSTFSADDPLEFARELETIIESIKTKKDLPPRYIVDGLIDVLRYWMTTHGVPSISKLAESMEKIDSMKSRHQETIAMYKHTIDDLTRQSRHDERVHIEQRHSMELHDEELTDKLTAATQQLATAALLEQQIFGLQRDLESKSSDVERKTNTVIAQQQRINQLEADKLQNLKLIDAFKLKVARWAKLENDLKAQQLEVRELERERNELQSKYAATCSERESLFAEKLSMQRTVAEYGKLKDNLAQHEANELEYALQIKALREELRALREEKRAMIDSVIQREIGDLEAGNGRSPCPQTIECDAVQTPSPQKRTPTPTPSRGSTPKFVRFSDGVRTYNTSEDVSFANSRKMSVTMSAPPFDEREFEEFKTGKYPMSELDALSEWNAEEKENGTKGEEAGSGWGSHFGFKTMYRSLAIVTVSCLAYVLYSRYQHRAVAPPRHLREAMTRNIEREIKTY